MGETTIIPAADASAPDLTAFYTAFSPLCFSLLGLWLIVVQTRYSEWRRSAVHRSRAHTLAANFALPGLMALIALVDPADTNLWRVGFTCVAIVAVAFLSGMMIRGPGRGEHPLASLIATWFSIALYGAIGILAVGPGLVNDIGIRLTPLQVEEILLSLLVFTAVAVAWLLMFDQLELDDDRRDAASTDSLSRDHTASRR
jgi:hypothetical protein